MLTRYVARLGGALLAGRTSPLPTVAPGPVVSAFVTPEGPGLPGLQPLDDRARLVVRP